MVANQIDEVFFIRSQMIASMFLPENWALKRERGGAGYLLTDGLHPVTEFLHGKPNLFLAIAAVRESIANSARRQGLDLAMSMKASPNQIVEPEIARQGENLGRTLANSYLARVRWLMKPANLNDEAMRELENLSADRFSQAFYLSTIYNVIGFGPREYSASAIGRYPVLARSALEVLDNMEPFNTWSDDLGAEFTGNRADDYVGVEPTVGMEQSRAIFRVHSFDLLHFLTGDVNTAGAAEHPSVVRFTNHLAKTFAYYLPVGGITSAQERLDTQRKWLLQLFDEALRKGQIREVVPAPPLALSEISPREAEELCCEWMKHLGAPDAKVTQLSGDGGIDIESTRYIAQVKNYSGSVGAPELYQFIGVASVDGRKPLYFTSGTYTRQAISAASRAGLPLFRYSAAAGTIDAENKWATQIITEGLDIVEASILEAPGHQ